MDAHPVFSKWRATAARRRCHVAVPERPARSPLTCPAPAERIGEDLPAMLVGGPNHGEFPLCQEDGRVIRATSSISELRSAASDSRSPTSVRILGDMRWVLGGLTFSRVRLFLGVLLFVAASLKLRQFYAASFVGVKVDDWVGMALAAAEFSLAIWLLSGFHQRSARRVALLAFGAFALYSAFAAINGYSSCGCFGSVQVRPMLTLFIDLAALSTMLLCRRTDACVASNADPASRRPLLATSTDSRIKYAIVRVSSTACVAMIGIAFVGLLLLLGDVGDMVGTRLTGANGVVLNPDQWLGKRLPILGDVDCSDELSRGDWKVVVYHHDCPRCQEVIAASLASVRVSTESRSSRVMFLELPPFGGSPLDDLPSENIRHCRMARHAHEWWYIATPLEVQVSAGTVVGVSHE
jgi:hypothetical protein